MTTPTTTKTAAREVAVEPMTAKRAAYFLRRFKADEKMLGPNEQLALDYCIATLTQQQGGEQEAGDGKVWRCFLCDESFTDEREAALHFGTRMEGQSPACAIDVAEYRRMEAQAARYADEDADVHRAMRRQQGEHAAALRRAEEEGYAKGLRDSGLCPCANTSKQAAVEAGP